jgi:putative hemolysin
LENEPPQSEPYLSIAFLLFVSFEAIGIPALLLLALLAMSALISGSEVAFFSLGPNELDKLKDEDSVHSKRIIYLRERPRTLLATILTTNNLINVAIVIVAEYLTWNIFSEELFTYWGKEIHERGILNIWSDTFIARAISFLITTIGTTFLLVLFGEVAPKIYAKVNNLAFAKLMALPLIFLNRLFGPVSRVLVRWSNFLERRLARHTNNNSSSVREDIDKAIDLTVSNHQDAQREADLLKSIVKFSNVPVKQIMRSRVDVVALPVDSDYTTVLNTVRESGFSRIPIYADEFDNVIGILYAKDLLGHLDKEEDFEWRDLIRTHVLYVPEAKKINDLLKEFQLKRNHMAVVVDEFGGSAGLVTLEDVMEEVVGEIWDEFDEEEETDYVKLNDREYIFEGKTHLNDVCRIMEIDINVFDAVRGDTDSLAGLILESTRFIPKKEVEITLAGYRFIVVSVNKRRIERIKVVKPESKNEPSS